MFKFRKLQKQKDVDKQSGTATLETAIVISILIILMLITVEFGRGFYYSNEFNKSVRNAARYLSSNALNSTGTMEITAVNRLNAKNLLIYGDVLVAGAPFFPGLTVDNIVITEANPYISVEAEWVYLTLFGSALPVLGISSASENSLTLKSASTMRALE
jgi:Flp pilus assembly protein TadG